MLEAEKHDILGQLFESKKREFELRRVVKGKEDQNRELRTRLKQSEEDRIKVQEKLFKAEDKNLGWEDQVKSSEEQNQERIMYLESLLQDAQRLAESAEERAKWHQEAVHRANREATNARRTLEENEREHVVTLRGLVQQLKRDQGEVEWLKSQLKQRIDTTYSRATTTKPWFLRQKN